MSFNFNKRKIMKTLLKSNGGGCGCKKPKLSDVHHPTPKPKISIYQNKNPSSLTSSSTTATTSAADEDFTPTTISEPDTTTTNNKNHFIPKPSPKLINSIAIEKDSKDPHKDFRHSMLQMIFEREIYSESELQQLLECFLQLNAPCHHHIIIQAFIEICEEIFPKKLDDGSSGGGKPARRNQNVPQSR
ncbi:transcription repressor OFP6-like [Lotus japonicus]|uniref:transcription repressor OFP6-like n=1 Tax=Lotus japonicus TaxID=34305 RepID=UPI00258AF71E|nr:transcription repressor OFP6-like [Lotus japonicus]